MIDRILTERLKFSQNADEASARLARLKGWPVFIGDDGSASYTIGTWRQSALPGQYATSSYIGSLIVAGNKIEITGNPLDRCNTTNSSWLNGYVVETTNLTSWSGRTDSYAGYNIASPIIGCPLASSAYLLTKGNNYGGMNTWAAIYTIDLKIDADALCYNSQDKTVCAVNIFGDCAALSSSNFTSTTLYETGWASFEKGTKFNTGSTGGVNCYCDVCWNPSLNMFYFATNNGLTQATIAKSSSGLSWTRTYTGSGECRAIAASTKKPWIIAGDGTKVAYTKNGTSWSTTDVGNAVCATCYISDFDIFAISTSNGKVKFSSNLTNWTKEVSNPSGVSYFDEMRWSEYHKAIIAIKNNIKSIYILPITAA